jgi:hypothetical protein
MGIIINDFVYGKYEIKEKVIEDLLKSKPIQRIKQISQSGIPKEFDRPGQMHYSRYDHSVGVMLLLRRLGASVEEQISGLLHDISHTAFSHTVDMIFGSYEKQSLQDSLHKSYFIDNDLKNILNEYGYEAARISNIKLFELLERDIPDLCADRLDYSLRDGVYDKQADIKEEISNLINRNGEIVFGSKEYAIKYGRLFVHLERKLYANKENTARRYVFAVALKDALNSGVISKEDLIYGVDQEIVEKIKNTKIKEIDNIINGLKNNDFEVYDGGDVMLKVKLRYVNPKFVDKNGISTAMEVSREYKELVENSIKEDKEGYLVKIKVGNIEIG